MILFPEQDFAFEIAGQFPEANIGTAHASQLAKAHVCKFFAQAADFHLIVELLGLECLYFAFFA